MIFSDLQKALYEQVQELWKKVGLKEEELEEEMMQYNGKRATENPEEGVHGLSLLVPVVMKGGELRQKKLMKALIEGVLSVKQMPVDFSWNLIGTADPVKRAMKSLVKEAFDRSDNLMGLLVEQTPQGSLNLLKEVAKELDNPDASLFGSWLGWNENTYLLRLCNTIKKKLSTCSACQCTTQ